MPLRHDEALPGRNERLVAVFFGESRTNPQVGERLQQMIREGVELLGRYQREHVEAGELRTHDAEVTARSLLYTVFMLHLTREPADRFVCRSWSATPCAGFRRGRTDSRILFSHQIE